MDPISSERTPSQRIGLFLMLWAGCYLLFTLLSQAFLIAYLGQEAYKQLIEGTAFPAEYIPVIRYLQIVVSIGIFAVPAMVFVMLNKPRDWTFFTMNRVPDWRLIGLTVLLIAFCMPVVAWAFQVNQDFHFPSAFQGVEDSLQEVKAKNDEFLKAVLNMQGAGDFIINFIMIALVAPIVEELLFRGTLQQLLQRSIGAHWAIILTGAVFSFTHGDFYGFLPRWLLGILLGYMFFWSRNLWVPIFAHFLFNGLQVVMVFLFQNDAIHVDIEQESFPPQVTMLATALLFATLYIFDRIANRSKPEDGEGLGKSVLDD